MGVREGKAVNDWRDLEHELVGLSDAEAYKVLCYIYQQLYKENTVEGFELLKQAVEKVIK